MANSNSVTLEELREYFDQAGMEWPQWMQDWYGWYGPELWVEVQEDSPLEQPRIVQ